MAGRPLSPATRLSLGGPLPRQLADRTWTPPRVRGPEGSPPFTAAPCDAAVVRGITGRFQPLSPAQGQVVHALLTRLPLGLRPEGRSVVRLACLIHAASVRSEPGSNPSIDLLLSDYVFGKNEPKTNSFLREDVSGVPVRDPWRDRARVEAGLRRLHILTPGNAQLSKNEPHARASRAPRVPGLTAPLPRCRHVQGIAPCLVRLHDQRAPGWPG